MHACMLCVELFKLSFSVVYFPNPISVSTLHAVRQRPMVQWCDTVTWVSCCCKCHPDLPGPLLAPNWRCDWASGCLIVLPVITQFTRSNYVIFCTKYQLTHSHQSSKSQVLFVWIEDGVYTEEGYWGRVTEEGYRWTKLLSPPKLPTHSTGSSTCSLKLPRWIPPFQSVSVETRLQAQEHMMWTNHV